jgi:hypothetical protein
MNHRHRILPSREAAGKLSGCLHNPKQDASQGGHGLLAHGEAAHRYSRDDLRVVTPFLEGAMGELLESLIQECVSESSTLLSQDCAVIVSL